MPPFTSVILSLPRPDFEVFVISLVLKKLRIYDPHSLYLEKKTARLTAPTTMRINWYARSVNVRDKGVG